MQKANLLIKMAALLLVVIMVFSIAGCGKQETILSYYEDVPASSESSGTQSDDENSSSDLGDSSQQSQQGTTSSNQSQPTGNGGQSNTQTPSGSDETQNVTFNFSRKTFVGFDPSDKTGAVIPDTEWAHYKELGVKRLRVTLNYDAVGKSETEPDYLLVDEFVKRAKKEGIEVLMLLSYEAAPSIPTKKGDWEGQTLYLNPADKLVDISRMAIKHFTKLGVMHYEIWNEPNGVWGVNPEEYADMIAQIYEKCKYTEKWCDNPEKVKIIAFSLDANAHGASDGVSTPAANFVVKVYQSPAYKNFKKKYNHSPWDIVSMHPYGTVITDASGNLVKNNVKNSVDKVLVKYMQLYGDAHLPIWITEWGINTEDKIQADTTYHMIKELSKIPQVECVFFFKYNYGGTKYGIINGETTKPVFDSLKKIIKELNK